MKILVRTIINGARSQEFVPTIHQTCKNILMTDIIQRGSQGSTLDIKWTTIEIPEYRNPNIMNIS